MKFVFTVSVFILITKLNCARLEKQGSSTYTIQHIPIAQLPAFTHTLLPFISTIFTNLHLP